MKRYGEHRFPGKLFIVEGIDGSGKSTQLMLLHQWLQAEGYGVVFSEWNSSPLVKETTKRGKKKQNLTPATFSLIHATDFADRLEHDLVLVVVEVLDLQRVELGQDVVPEQHPAQDARLRIQVMGQDAPRHRNPGCTRAG